MSGKGIEKLQDELKWVRIREEQDMSFFGRLKSKGITGFLVPLGCAVTTGVLCSGIYHMKKRNSKMQQVLMRYRIAAQGVTVVIAMIGIVNIPFNKSKYQ